MYRHLPAILLLTLATSCGGKSPSNTGGSLLVTVDAQGVTGVTTLDIAVTLGSNTTLTADDLAVSAFPVSYRLQSPPISAPARASSWWAATAATPPSPPPPR
jgi:hypothetical protein